MIRYAILTLLASLLFCTAPAFALDDTAALSGLTSVRAIFDVRTADEKKLQFILGAIRDTMEQTQEQGVKPRYIASMRGPTVKLLVRARAGDPKLQQKTVALINELKQSGIRLEACGYALDMFGLDEEDLYQGVDTVGNSLNSLIGYQTKGYALVTMN
ncbi:MAG: DsrE family protein [Desulfuromonadales bacterium]|nr:DsrE family protein [Desulfuromonadales bacterium]